MNEYARTPSTGENVGWVASLRIHQPLWALSRLQHRRGAVGEGDVAEGDAPGCPPPVNPVNRPCCLVAAPAMEDDVQDGRLPFGDRVGSVYPGIFAPTRDVYRLVPNLSVRSTPIVCKGYAGAHGAKVLVGSRFVEQKPVCGVWVGGGMRG